MNWKNPHYEATMQRQTVIESCYSPDL